MKLYMVVWNEGHWAMVSPAGDVVDASDEVGRRELQERLASTALSWVAADDFMKAYEPGEAGHLEVVLNDLPGAVVTSDA